YLDKHDPVRKAERVLKKHSVRTERNPEKQNKSATYKKREPIPTKTKHIYTLRDQGRCTWVENGKRCSEDRWVDGHHIIPVHQGGTNTPENLTTLCGFHHDLVHQLSLPIDGQINWLRSP